KAVAETGLGRTRNAADYFLRGRRTMWRLYGELGTHRPNGGPQRRGHRDSRRIPAPGRRRHPAHGDRCAATRAAGRPRDDDIRRDRAGARRGAVGNHLWVLRLLLNYCPASVIAFAGRNNRRQAVPTRLTCVSCARPFDVPDDARAPWVECPHCKARNVHAAATKETPPLHERWAGGGVVLIIFSVLGGLAGP